MAGDQKGKPSAGNRGGKGEPATKRASPPPGYYSGRDCRFRKRSDAGAPGAEPPAKLTYSLPLPRRGRGSGVYPTPPGKGGRKTKLKAV